MPDILSAKIEQVVRIRRNFGLTGKRIQIHETVCSARQTGGSRRNSRLQQPQTVGECKRRFRRPWSEGYDRVLQGADPDSLLPAELVFPRQPDKAVPTNPVDYLNVKQVKMDRMGVDPVMGDLPELCLAVLYQFSGRVLVVLHDENLINIVGIGEFDT
ncbi:hypothetical protein OR1_02346 [Geobacter sp. OR-1]|nr:hypothetical protein OR1_02346 [Geobacter sp. OR-1]